jgi:asparagine synthase (glutamine-hydrolysing)
MCGIVGIVHRDAERPVAPEAIRMMSDTIQHRGPDDAGAFVAGSVGLGMRRLSIIDVAGGHQPITNEDGSLVIVFNGEIYNYRELRRELAARGHAFRTQSDTETVLHLYEQLGPQCVERLRGMFAFAIWDTRRRTLFLARDRFGIKPLYTASGPWGLAFASELKALVAVGLTTRELDWEALDGYFQLGYIPAPATPFRDVRKLEAGHWLLWRESGPTVRRAYWDLPRETRVPPPQVATRVGEWIDEAVTTHLVSDVPVAAFLSGGLDSSAVVASMAAAGGRAHAFTARYAGHASAGADETALADQLARRYGARLTVVDVRPELDEVFERIVYALDEPHADDSAVPTWVLSEAVGASYKVALAGIGGDELFAGYRRHLGLGAAAWYGRLPATLRRWASAWSTRMPEPAGGGLGVDRLKRFLRSGGGSGETPDRFLAMLSRVADETRFQLYAPALRELASGLGRESFARSHFRELHHSGGSRRGLAAALYFDYKTFLPDDVLALSDRLAMAHSLEVRVPLVDHVLVERVFPLPARLKIGWWERKRLLKRALRDRLPVAHFRAPKRGFVGPTAAWLRHELRPLLADELSASRLARLGYFEPRAVTGLLDEHFDRRQNREGILWALLCFSTWHRLNLEQGMVRPYRSRHPAPTAPILAGVPA